MNEKDTKRLTDSHTKMLTILVSYYKTELTELESMPTTKLMFEKTITEAVKLDTLIKLAEKTKP